MKKNSNRLIRINQEVKHDLTTILREDIKDPRVSPLTSIVKVDVTADLKFCKVYVSVMGDASDQKETIEGLKSSAGHIRSELAHRTNLRNTPQLSFILDHSIEYGVEISALIDKVVQTDQDKEVEDNVETEGTENEIEALEDKEVHE
ncbi:30S ribosome-binding factor RbfA [Petrocella sp. FN5]|uniref:30S ribosome-binding factor RbfA n=1 Tax=Petrocella sp. FN5 TaxID=3032002 RepID=UPI0023DCA442|nr:30S ribosome-binding factor RbfA [Petrocella sp. FN5]MDF1616362.1 30S ribosome-binding factor RbfA [Petrocella sp. FN5]